MSIYDNEGAVNWLVIRREIEGEIPGVTVDLSTGDCSALVEFCDQTVCELFDDPEGFKICCVCPHGDCDTLSTLSSVLARVRELAEAARAMQLDLVIKDCVGIPGTVEEAPAEPTLREFLVEFRRVVEIGRKHLAPPPWNSMLDWLDARLGEEEKA